MLYSVQVSAVTILAF